MRATSHASASFWRAPLRSTRVRVWSAFPRRRSGTNVPIDVSVGFYEVWRNKLYNSVMYVSLGEALPLVRHVHRKVFLPTYGLFDEERFVERGREIRAFDTTWGRVAMLVCEDVWHSLSGTIAALDGAQLIICPTAPPARGAWPRSDDVPGPASAARWERLARDMADEHGLYVALAHLVGSEGGKQFPGASMLASPKGDVLVRGPLWVEALVVATIDLDDVTRARADMPLIADLETMLPHLQDAMRKVDAGAPHILSFDGMELVSSTEPIEETKFKRAQKPKGPQITVVTDTLGGRPPSLQLDSALVEEWLHVEQGKSRARRARHQVARRRRPHHRHQRCGGRISGS